MKTPALRVGSDGRSLHVRRREQAVCSGGSGLPAVICKRMGSCACRGIWAQQTAL